MAQESPNTMTRLQTLQSSVTWYHVEFKAEILLDTYSGLLSEQSMILAMNSSFVDPLIQFESQLRIIELSFRKVFSMPSLIRVKAMGKTSEDIEDLENLYQNIFNIFEDTLLILVSKDFYKIQILKEMATWMSEDSFYLQERAMMVITRVLIFASKRVKKYPSIDAPSLGLLAAELSLFCSHNDPEIIQQAMAGMNYVLYIALCQNSNVVKFKYSKLSEEENLKIIRSDVESLAKITQEEKAKIAQSVGQILLPQLLTDFVWTLLKKLSSPNTKLATDAASLLKLTLEFHAQKITRVSKIVDNIYDQLCENSSHMMKGVLLHTISLLTRASPKKVIFQLMEFPVPADETLLLLWQAASMESTVASEVLKTILLILKGKPGEIEDSLGEKRRFSLYASNMMPVAASQALCTFLPVTSYRKVVVKLFPEFLMTLLLQLFYCSQHLKETAQERPLTLSEYNFPQFPETLHYVYKVAVEGPRRSEDSIVTIIFFAEIESVCNLLLPVLDAFLSKEHTVIIQAMLTLRNILGKLDKAIYSTLCIRIAASYSPLMDHVNGDIQCMAIRHFGELLMDMNHYNWMLQHIVLGSLVPLILFLESTEPRIVNACRYTLTICITQLKWSTAYLLKEESYNFESVVLDVCNNLLSSYESVITDLISDTLGFLGSSRTFLKKGAIILVGYLGKSREYLLLKEEIDIMIEAIERLTREEDPLIKVLAEKTHKLFKEMANRMASSTIKQTFRKWVKMFCTKKLRLVYDVANIIALKESDTESTKRDSLLQPHLKIPEEQYRDIDEDIPKKCNVKKFEYFT
uniref:maestro heat-like repeat-containing protein family member 9 isoform X3 n=1 Tax=Arvicanthis niloticus TaxID=61156 RepID=UPI0014861645|nr:maestro heat-like repeat-containing protein family member 9 isoform X3 [Arvicanthis niloticus]